MVTGDQDGSSHSSDVPDAWGSFVPAGPRPDRHDSGAGSLGDFTYGLIPRFLSARIRLAGSDPFADELGRLASLAQQPSHAFVERRLLSEERVDAPMPVRLWVGAELSGVVGFVPHGLEAPVDACLGRLSDRGKGARIPCVIVSTRRGIRLDLAIGRAY